ncbi:head GIN domain-containing protein [Anditalea andensis]|uniref:Putative auto-transporter adhesin head GIN domain-containing protein n=1 Tax=Anditalea andensis TaxID=1048983 RepID=A0A074KYU3_9BACT|nr:head GIN domain-containing protein [Anditalea andensis]KEO72798.1 hypothetical protein EL17_14290 [Anditalea andensis]
MIRNITYLIALIAVLVAPQAYGQTSEDTRKLSAFNGIKISNAIEAEFEKGDRHEIQITASGLDVDKVETNITNRQLEIKLARGNFRSTSVRVKVIYVDIDQIEASTSSRVFFKDVIESKTVKITASTSSYVEAKVNCSNLQLDAASNAKIFINGTADNLNIRAVTSAEINAKDLQANTADIVANTAAKADIRIKDSIKGSAATAAKVYYSGNPNIVDIKTSTAGAIEQR